MKTALIISEYNPFHKGHKYQIDDIRKTYGDDTAVIALMSGNYTQRGDVAIMDKYLRARCAVSGGVNLVLMLPFPYSASSAEFFASAGVEIANSLGVVDVLAFGSECGNLDTIYAVAKNMLSDEFTEAIEIAKNDRSKTNLGYPKLCESIYNDIFGVAVDKEFFTPNNILAIEYVKCIIKTNSAISPYTCKRIGADYNSEKVQDTPYQSATAIRNEFFKNPISAIDFLPNTSKVIVLKSLEENLFPCDTEKLASAVLSFLRLNSPVSSCNIHDADGGLYNRLIAAGHKATSISDLIKLASTKKYTTARIKRALWYSFFGVTSSDVRTPPKYTQVLAMDSIGRVLLKRIKKTTSFPIITKPSSYDGLDEIGARQKKLSDTADFIFELSKPIPSPADTAMKVKPFVKKDE